MNHLNSVILEGNVKELFIGENESTIVVGSMRHYKNADNKNIDEETVVSVVTKGSVNNIIKRMVDENKMTLGRGLRVVGRLFTEKWINGETECSVLRLLAEHIEFKPLPVGGV